MSFYTKNGIDVNIFVGSYLLSTDLMPYDDGLHGELVISGSEDAARQATFSVVSKKQTFVTGDWLGKQVRIFIKRNNSWYLRFFGYLDNIELNFFNGITKFFCSDRMQQRIKDLPNDFVSSTGTYNNYVFDDIKDVETEFNARLTTVSASFNYDNEGTPRITNWAGKSIADVTINKDEVWYRQPPIVNIKNPDKIVNTLYLNFTYTYNRLHQQTVNFVFDGFSDFIADWWNQGRPSFPEKNTINNVAYTGDWTISTPGGVNFVNVWPENVYSFGSGYIHWKPNLVENELKQRTKFDGYLKDSLGNFVTSGDPPRLVPRYVPVLDANNQPVYDIVRTTVIDTSSHLCRAASWTSCKRFTQKVNEQYTIRLYSPSAVSQYGEINESIDLNINDDFDNIEWDNSKNTAFVNYNYYINRKNDYNNALSALAVLARQAERRLYEAHRNIYLQFRTKRIMNVDLHHTIDVTLDQNHFSLSKDLQLKAKLTSFSDVINFSSGEHYTTIEMRGLAGYESDITASLQVAFPSEDPSYIGTVPTVSIPVRAGLDPESPEAQNLIGWFCNRALENSLQRTTFNQRFIVDYPKIPDILTQPITYQSPVALNSFTVRIPKDLFSWSY